VLRSAPVGGPASDSADSTLLAHAESLRKILQSAEHMREP